MVTLAEEEGGADATGTLAEQVAFKAGLAECPAFKNGFPLLSASRKHQDLQCTAIGPLRDEEERIAPQTGDLTAAVDMNNEVPDATRERCAAANNADWEQNITTPTAPSPEEKAMFKRPAVRKGPS